MNKFRLKINGPSVLIVSYSNHRRDEGECFVIKYPSGNLKKVVQPALIKGKHK